jgi:hypothetical protein
MAEALLIEDDEMNRDVHSRRLIRRGYHMVFAMGSRALSLRKFVRLIFSRHSAPSRNHTA